MIDETRPSRRGFYLAGIYGLGAVMGAALTIPAAIYLFFPPRAKKAGAWVEAADLTKLTAGVPEEVTFQRDRVDGWKVTSEKTTAWLVKAGENKVIAFAPQCTHLGCAYHWDNPTKNFVCPCHTSAFSMEGKVLSGPAPRPLDRYAVKLQNGKILLGEVQKAPSLA